MAVAVLLQSITSVNWITWRVLYVAEVMMRTKNLENFGSENFSPQKQASK